MIEEAIKTAVRDVADFPKPGIIFKDITPILKDQDLCTSIIEAFVSQLNSVNFDAIAGIESRGFLFGQLIANRLNKPFIPIRKQGKLPYKVISEHYNLEYGTATIEMHEDAFEKEMKILIHDDLLATGGTVEAASKLIEKMGGSIAGYTFIIELKFLNGRQKLHSDINKIIALASY